MKPSTYWEERCQLAKEALERLSCIVLLGNPMLRDELQSWANQWGRLRAEIHAKHEAPATKEHP